MAAAHDFGRRFPWMIRPFDADRRHAYSYFSNAMTDISVRIPSIAA
jgi:hypothetical protein